MIGYDLDGVIANTNKPQAKEFYRDNKIDWKEYNKEVYKAYKHSVLIRNPKGSFYIITGRSKMFRRITFKWLEEKGVKPIQAYFIDRKRTLENMIKFKVEKIKELNITEFYEDEPKIARELSKLTNIKIYLTKNIY